MESALSVVLFGFRSAALGAAGCAFLVAVVEVLVARRVVNAAMLLVAAVLAWAVGRAPWEGMALYGVLVLALGASSPRLALVFWGFGMLVEGVRRWRGVR